MSSQLPSVEHDSSARIGTNTNSFLKEEKTRTRPESASGDEHEAEPLQPERENQLAEGGQRVTFAPADHAAQHADKASTYYSARSRLSSLFTRSTGKRSQNGATWMHALSKTMNSGFGSTTLVSEGLERGGYLPPLTGVGRIGKAPSPVPASMLRALGVKQKVPDPASMSMVNLLGMDNSEVQTLHERLHGEGHDFMGGFRRGTAAARACDVRGEGVSRAMLPFHGMTLEALYQRDGTLVPSVVSALMEVVEKHALHLKTLYYSGYISYLWEYNEMQHDVFMGLRHNDVSALKQVDFSKPSGFQIEWATDMLLVFFAQLPEPLLITPYFHAWHKAAETADLQERRRQISALVSNLPQANRVTLIAWAQHIRKVQARNPRCELCLRPEEVMWSVGGYGSDRTQTYGEREDVKVGNLQRRILQTIFDIYGEESEAAASNEEQRIE